MSSRSARCRACRRPLEAKAFACPSCGTLLSDVDCACAVHDARAAEGTCIVCGVPMCAECRTAVEAAWICRLHRSTAAESSVVFESRTLAAAEAVGRNLELNDLPVMIFAHADQIDIRPLPAELPVQVRVRRGQESAAREVMDRLGLGDLSADEDEKRTRVRRGRVRKQR